jgi:hypothetical protein
MKSHIYIYIYFIYKRQNIIYPRICIICRIGRKVDEILARDLGNHLRDRDSTYMLQYSCRVGVSDVWWDARMQNIPQATARRLYYYDCYEVLLFITFYPTLSQYRRKYIVLQIPSNRNATGLFTKSLTYYSLLGIISQYSL